MEIVLLDTDVFSFLWQDRPEGEPYRPLVAGRIVALSFTSVGEAHYGAFKRGWGERRRAELEAALRPCLVLPYHRDLAAGSHGLSQPWRMLPTTLHGRWSARLRADRPLEATDADRTGRARRGVRSRRAPTRGWIALLEHDAGVPEWMTEPTTNALYGAAELLGEGTIASATFLRDGNRMTITRQTCRTLDRVLHETTEAIGSVRGVLVTRDAAQRVAHHGDRRRAGSGSAAWSTMSPCGRPAGGSARRWVVSGHVRRDHLGRPDRVAKATIEPVPDTPLVTVAQMGGALEGGPESVTWLREQRGG